MTDRNYPKLNEQKATEATSVLLELHGGEMSHLKLIKLLYLLDRKALELWERPVTYDIYYSMKQGQVLSGVLNLVHGNTVGDFWHKHIAQKDSKMLKLEGEKIQIGKLSRAEIDLLKSIYSDYGHLERFELGDLTKNLPEYKQTTRIVKRRRTRLKDILTALNFEKEDIKRVYRKLEERANLEAIFEG